MKFKNTFFSVVIVLLFCLSAVSGYIWAAGSGESNDNPDLVIAYTNNVEGYLEPCG
jgi:hypothetical protein